MSRQIRFASATARGGEAEAAAGVLVEQVRDQLQDKPDLALVFLSSDFIRHAKTISDALRESLHPRVLVGCSCEGVIGCDTEIEREPAVVMVAAQMPRVELTPFAMRAEDLRKPDGARAILQRSSVPSGTKMFLVVADPFSTPMDQVLDAFNDAYDGVPIVGGMASGSPMPGGNTLLVDGNMVPDGAVAVAFDGDFEVDVIVSQGCRPIGPALRVTQSDGNVIQLLEGERALDQLQDLIQQISDDERDLLQNGLFVGRAIDSKKEVLGRGDFLIRGVVGVDRESGAIAMGDYVDDGEVVQFHVHDAATAEEDLEMMMTPQTLFGDPSGALLFSCNGRGTRLYDHPNGDLSTLKRFFPSVDVAGFFCAGEIGPIGGKNFLHGHTVSLALFRPGGQPA